MSILLASAIEAGIPETLVNSRWELGNLRPTKFGTFAYWNDGLPIAEALPEDWLAAILQTENKPGTLPPPELAFTELVLSHPKSIANLPEGDTGDYFVYNRGRLQWHRYDGDADFATSHVYFVRLLPETQHVFLTGPFEVDAVGGIPHKENTLAIFEELGFGASVATEPWQKLLFVDQDERSVREVEEAKKSFLKSRATTHQRQAEILQELDI